MKIQVYTAIYGDKDRARDDVTVMSGYDKFTSPVMNAKIYKVLPHKFLDCDISIWLDGNIFLKIPPRQLVQEFLQDADMAVLEHYKRQSIDWEAMMIKRIFKRRTPWVRDEVDRQMEYYQKSGKIPKRAEMAMGGLIIRRNIPIVNQFNEAWWAEICRWSQRDQLSFPVVRRQFPQMKVNLVKGSIKNHPYLTYLDHAHYNT